MNNSVNPLMNFARRAELSIKLPTRGGWYNEDMVEYSPNGEVKVYPMLPQDELMLLNPDALLSGQANIDVLRSCIPDIKHPEKLLYPDANVLFLAIQKATYGDELTITTPCPYCQERMQNMSDEEISSEEKAGTLMTHNFDVSYNIGELLQEVTYLEPEYIVELDNGLKVYVSPNTVYDKSKFKNLTLTYEKIIKMSQESVENLESIVGDESVSTALNEVYMVMNRINAEILAACILKIVLPDETVVTDKSFIKEFLLNSSSSVVSSINIKVKEINDIGVPSKLHIQCPCCGKEWDDKFYGYNQSDFFGIGSLS